MIKIILNCLIIILGMSLLMQSCLSADESIQLSSKYYIRYSKMNDGSYKLNLLHRNNHSILKYDKSIELSAILGKIKTHLYKVNKYSICAVITGDGWTRRFMYLVKINLNSKHTLKTIYKTDYEGNGSICKMMLHKGLIIKPIYTAGHYDAKNLFPRNLFLRRTIIWKFSNDKVIVGNFYPDINADKAISLRKILNQVGSERAGLMERNQIGNITLYRFTNNSLLKDKLPDYAKNFPKIQILKNSKGDLTIYGIK
jgi:hypothetical protein